MLSFFLKTKLSQRVNLFLLLTQSGWRGNHKVLNENILSCESFIGGTANAAPLRTLITKVTTTTFPVAHRSKAPHRSQSVLRCGPCKLVKMLKPALLISHPPGLFPYETLRVPGPGCVKQVTPLLLAVAMSDLICTSSRLYLAFPYREMNFI